MITVTTPSTHDISYYVIGPSGKYIPITLPGSLWWNDYVMGAGEPEPTDECFLSVEIEEPFMRVEL